MHQLAHGAEAVLYLDRYLGEDGLDRGRIIKERLSKGYRLPHLDQALRQFRTRREAKILKRLEELNFPAPQLQEFSDTRMSIVMDFVPGEKLRDVLGKGLGDGLGKGSENGSGKGSDNDSGNDSGNDPGNDSREGFYTLAHTLAKEIGQKVGKLHQNDLIHGDLTTSNLIQHAETGQIHFIDFGLASFSSKVEDKAVDLFLLERALESRHYDLYPEVFAQVLEGYKEAYPGAEKVLERLEKVRRRGRNKGKF